MSVHPDGMKPEFQDLRLFRLPPEERGRPKWFVFLWMLVQASLWRWSPRPLWGWRRFLLRAFGATVGDGALIRPSVTVTYPWKVKIGAYSWVGDECTLYSLGEIQIGANVSIAHGVYFCTGYHDIHSLQFEQKTAPITIEDECWITNDVFVGPGVSIGYGAVVGARSSVFGNLPARAICFGTPAKPVKPRQPAI